MTTTTKTIGRARGSRYMRITVELREDDSRGLSGGFSVTGELWEPRGKWSGIAQWRNGREWDMGGCLHDEILLFAPELAPVIAVHLAAPDGTPMHAVANGWYFYSGASREYELRSYGAEYVARLGTDHQRAARALHVDPADLPVGMDKAAFHAYAETLTARWAQQARRARAVIDAMETEEDA